MLDVAALERDGFVAVPGVLSPEDAHALARRCAGLLEPEAPRHSSDKRAGGTRRAGDLLERLPEVRTVFDDAGVQDAVSAMVGAGVDLADVAFRSPGPRFGQQSLHADDQPLERAGECRAVTAILALCEFTHDNGATSVVPGSHLRPDLQRRAGRGHLPVTEVVLVGDAGTAFVFSAHLLHRGTRNNSPAPRPALHAQWRLQPPAQIG